MGNELGRLNWKKTSIFDKKRVWCAQVLKKVGLGGNIKNRENRIFSTTFEGVTNSTRKPPPSWVFLDATMGDGANKKFMHPNTGVGVFTTFFAPKIPMAM